ncbi:MAG TPA: DUF721 domain-containing protein [Armatimonadota bacterium]|jgi:hypothetical protein
MIQGQASIQSLLGGLLKNRQLVASMRRVMVMSLWEQVVGNLVAQKSWPEKVTDGVLTVGVTSHAWAAELALLKPQIITRYRQLLGRSALKDVEFRVGRRKAAHTDETRHLVVLHPQPEERPTPGPVPSNLFAGVSNPEVRDLLGPVFARLRAEREWKREHGWARCGACQRIYHGAACPHCGGTHPEAA